MGCRKIYIVLFSLILIYGCLGGTFVKKFDLIPALAQEGGAPFTEIPLPATSELESIIFDDHPAIDCDPLGWAINIDELAEISFQYGPTYYTDGTVTEYRDLGHIIGYVRGNSAAGFDTIKAVVNACPQSTRSGDTNKQFDVLANAVRFNGKYLVSGGAYGGKWKTVNGVRTFIPDWYFKQTTYVTLIQLEQMEAAFVVEHGDKFNLEESEQEVYPGPKIFHLKKYIRKL